MDDLVSAGVVGLISAIDRFDPTHGVKLKTYAEYKIRGAIIDSLRSMDWAPRQQRMNARQMELALVTLEQKLQRTPTEDEIAAELAISVDEYRDRLTDLNGLSLNSLDQPVGGEEDGRDLMQSISGQEENWPSQILERSELTALLVKAIERMPYSERTVISLYYHEKLTLKEIATVMEFHESRISQIKTQAILRLRTFLQKRWPSKGTRQ